MNFYIISFFSVLVVFSLTLSAQPHRHHASPHDRAERKAMHDELRTHFEEKVVPLVQPQREKLNNYLSQDEKNEILKIRQGLKSLAESRKMQGKASGLKRQKREDVSEEQREAMHEHMKARRKLMTRAWVIVDAHEDEIDQLLGEVRPELEALRVEGKKIMDKYRGAENEEKAHPRKGRGHKRGMRGAGGEMRQIVRPLGFLLWDPAEAFPSPADLSESSVFPNPTTGTHQLDYEVKSPGVVSIKLVNKGAESVKEVINEYKEAGKYSLKIDLSELEEGLYFYHIKTADGVQTQKVVVRR